MKLDSICITKRFVLTGSGFFAYIQVNHPAAQTQDRYVTLLFDTKNSLVLNQGFANAIKNGSRKDGLGNVTLFTKKFVGAVAGIITVIANSQIFD